MMAVLILDAAAWYHVSLREISLSNIAIFIQKKMKLPVINFCLTRVYLPPGCVK